MVAASKKLCLELDMSNGSMKTIEINNPVSGKTLAQCETLVTWIINNQIFRIEGETSNVDPTALLNAYVKEVTITELT